MYNPISTYRLQFNSNFTLAHLDALLPYLQTLGITTIYASPIFVATPGSSHGYDNVDPTRINPEIGTDAQLRAISHRLRQAGMGWVQDIVPNHMAFHPNNEWLMDLLEKGPLSRFAHYFETSLASSFFHGRVMAPFLPASLADTTNRGELTLAYTDSRFVLEVNGNVLPLRPETYSTVLQANPGPPSDAIRQLLDQLDQLRHDDGPETYAPAWDEFRQQLTALMSNQTVGQYVAGCLLAINTDPDQQCQLAEDQHYRLCTEPESRREMNYRRFFTINGLICLNMGDETVFRHDHQLSKTLLDDGVFQGLRIDHVDGLFDPAQYLDRLRTLAGPDAYIVVEKILQGDEPLPISWPVAGTSGYDFLAFVNNVLTNGQNEARFRDFYHNLIGTHTSLPGRIRDRKAYFLAQYMGGERDNLHQYFLNLALADEAALAQLTPGSLTLAIGELLVQCPVYRYYGNQLPLPDHEATVLQTMLNTVRQTKPDLTTAVDLLEDALLTKPQNGDQTYNERAVRFYQRLMQFTSPLMAKGVEDTLLYTYNCFVGHNEVGDSPERFGMTPGAFHQTMHDRQTNWPLAQNATSTHDTKRGEDVRARLNVLTDLADEWLAEVGHWQTLNEGNPTDAPDPNDAYFMYQNLLGAYPMPGQPEDDFPNRFRLYMEKAMQEAKRHTTGWMVEETYHAGVRAFIDRMFDPQGAFQARFRPFHRKVADFGIVNSLTQLVLKCTCPGVPDIYQGSEGWDLSLVDPDNRRPVDFDRHQQEIADLTTRQQADDTTIWADLWQHRFDGRIKGWLTRSLLHERQQQPDVFAHGSYIPLSVEGRYQAHVLAFGRQHGPIWYVVAVPLHTAQLVEQQQVADVLALNWHDTRVMLPANAPTAWTSCLTGEKDNATGHLPVGTLFRQLPVALLRL